jgi:hypothetical protein
MPPTSPTLCTSGLSLLAAPRLRNSLTFGAGGTLYRSRRPRDGGDRLRLFSVPAWRRRPPGDPPVCPYPEQEGRAVSGQERTRDGARTRRHVRDLSAVLFRRSVRDDSG